MSFIPTAVAGAGEAAGAAAEGLGLFGKLGALGGKALGAGKNALGFLGPYGKAAAVLLTLYQMLSMGRDFADDKLGILSPEERLAKRQQEQEANTRAALTKLRGEQELDERFDRKAAGMAAAEQSGEQLLQMNNMGNQQTNAIMSGGIQQALAGEQAAAQAKQPFSLLEAAAARIS